MNDRLHELYNLLHSKNLGAKLCEVSYEKTINSFLF